MIYILGMKIEKDISNSRFYSILEKTAVIPASRIFIYNIIILLLILYFDYLNGEEISLSIFYFIPVSASAWFLGRQYSWIFSILSILCWVTADLTEHFSSNWLIALWNAASRMAIFIIIFSLIDAIKKALEKEKKLARIDSLTGISNYRSFYEAGEKEIYRAKRYRRTLSVAYMDADNFKQVNDKHGHEAGDALLKKIGTTILENIRESDLVARLGGDEFAIIFPETDAEKADIIVHHIKQALDNLIKEHDVPISFSIGVVTCSSGNCTVQDLIKHADAQMYQVKKSGKNNISCQSV